MLSSFRLFLDKTRAIWQPGKIKVQPSSDLAFSSTLLETSPPSLDQNVVVESQFKQHLCRICGRSFVTRGGLSHHMKVHGTKRSQCPICFSKFFHKHHMRDHVRNLHGLLICVVCQETFSFYAQKLYCDHLSECKKKRNINDTSWY